MRKTFIAALCITVMIVACSKSSDDNTPPGGGGGGGGGTFVPDCSGPAKSFTTDVSPIIASSCAISGCHAAGSTNGPGALTNFTQVFNARGAIRTAVASGLMPKTGTLTAAQKNAILCWIDTGGANN